MNVRASWLRDERLGFLWVLFAILVLAAGVAVITVATVKVINSFNKKKKVKEPEKSPPVQTGSIPGADLPVIGGLP